MDGLCTNLFRRAFSVLTKFEKLTHGKYFLKRNKRYNFRDILRLCSTDLQKKEVNSKPESKSFDEVLAQRRLEAQCSVLVQVASENSAEDLYSCCSQFGNVHQMFHYMLNNSKNFILVEYSSPREVRELLQKCTHTWRENAVPVYSPLLWFQTDKTKKNVPPKPMPDSVQFSSETPVNTKELKYVLMDADSIEDQILKLHNMLQLTELGSRLRYFTLHQLEVFFGSMFPYVIALPFGSSVNGFGKYNCDLDISLDLQGLNKNRNSDSRLVFANKYCKSSERVNIQRNMLTFSELIQHFVPGCNKVKQILHARVPIVRYQQEFTGVECDLSMTNMSGLYMSEMLYIYGELDWRVRPLVSVIRNWAQEVHVTESVRPTPSLSSYIVTIMVIFFLQNRPIPVLPSLYTLIERAGPEDHRVTKDGVDCTFLRDPRKLPASKNKEDLVTLLHGFYEFYEMFDFSITGLSVMWASSLKKPVNDPLYIENPLERELNISKNVSSGFLEKFHRKIRIAICKLESRSEPKKEECWGVGSLINQNEEVQASTDKNFKNKLKHFFEFSAEPEEEVPNNPSDSTVVSDTVKKVSDTKKTKLSEKSRAVPLNWSYLFRSKEIKQMIKKSRSEPKDQKAKKKTQQQKSL